MREVSTGVRAGGQSGAQHRVSACLVDDGGAGPSYSIKDSKPEVGLLEEILEDVAGREQVARSRRDAEVRRPGPARPAPVCGRQFDTRSLLSTSHITHCSHGP
jgi:hypothetical protein